MSRKAAMLVICALALSVGAARAAQSGTAEEARAMLEAAVAAAQADKAKALADFNAGEGGFKDRDLYVFCANATDGVSTAHPTTKGQTIKDSKDVQGFAFGQEIFSTATEGKISEIAYLWPRPGSDTPVEKVSFFTKVGDQICGVGYYK